MKKATSIFFFMFLCVIAIARSEAFPALLSDDQELNLPATGPDIKFQRIRHLGLGEGVEEDILSTPIKFPKAFAFGLSSEGKNDVYIRELVANYSSLKSLGIKQRRPLTADDLREIKKLVNLERLSINCPIGEGINLDFSKLTKLKRLSLGPQSDLSSVQSILAIDFPALRDLDIRGTKISDKFFQSLNAPLLHKVFLGNDSLESAALNPLQKFSNLRNLQLLNIPIKDAALPKRLQHVQIETDFDSTFTQR